MKPELKQNTVCKWEQVEKEWEREREKEREREAGQNPYELLLPCDESVADGREGVKRRSCHFAFSRKRPELLPVAVDRSESAARRSNAKLSASSRDWVGMRWCVRAREGRTSRTTWTYSWAKKVSASRAWTTNRYRNPVKRWRDTRSCLNTTHGKSVVTRVYTHTHTQKVYCQSARFSPCNRPLDRDWAHNKVTE